MRPHLLFFIIASVLLVVSCNKNIRGDGFTETETGVVYKLLAFGDSDKKPGTGEYIDVHMAYRTNKDSLFLETGFDDGVFRLIIPVTAVSFLGSFESYFTKMNEGDSIRFLVNADSLFSQFLKTPLPAFVKQGDTVKVDIKLKKVLNESAYKKAVDDYQLMLDNLETEERIAREKYLADNHIDAVPVEQDLYYLPVKDGTGQPVETGKTVYINYKGSFLSGKVFDSNNGSMPFEFMMGDEKQVIKGLELGLACMREGGKARFIIPSAMAFGPEGSSTKVVPPFTTVIYEVELLKVK